MMNSFRYTTSDCGGKEMSKLFCALLICSQPVKQYAQTYTAKILSSNAFYYNHPQCLILHDKSYMARTSIIPLSCKTFSHFHYTYQYNKQDENLVSLNNFKRRGKLPHTAGTRNIGYCLNYPFYFHLVCMHVKQ